MGQCGAKSDIVGPKFGFAGLSMFSTWSFTLDGDILILPREVVHLNRNEALKIIDNPKTNKKLRQAMFDWLFQEKVNQLQRTLSLHLRLEH